MGREVESVYALNLSVQQLERQPIDEVRETERGVVFVAHAQPPRVGTRVQIELTTPGDDEAVRLQALVIWSRPGKPGIIAGFKAQLENVPPGLMNHIKDLAVAAHMKLESRASEQKRSSVDGPIVERIRLREVSAPMQGESRTAMDPVPVSGPLPAVRPMPAAAPPPQGRPGPDGGPLLTTGRISVAPQTAAGAVRSFAPAPSAAAPLHPSDIAAGEAALPQRSGGLPVRVTFSSPRNYLLHYEQFLAHGTVYVTILPPPPVGATVAIELDVPDNEPALLVQAEVERYAQPPEVPQRGWIARIINMDEAITERLATATFIAGTPSVPASTTNPHRS